ncbi:amidohydrolase family protein [Crocinitomix algicola]|uniref:amidohydrolase family protein n=1 Tax=Crocinitomix algicola TaxID=1740263 RepID=UPI000834BE60|nr:amidohydrolase family protein [Crocinitomix algicola]
MLKSIFLGCFSILLCTLLNAQEIEPKNDVANAHQLIAFTNAKIIVSPNEVIERGTMVVQGDKILKLGLAVIPPKEAIRIDLKGFTIYPGFIDMYSAEGVQLHKFNKEGNSPQLYSLKKGPYYWNQAIHPEIDAVEFFDPERIKEKATYLKQGIGIINTHQKDGILRGTSVLVGLGNEDEEGEVIKSRVANHYSFAKGMSKQTYPSSQMGIIALIRQFFYDALWYAEQDGLKENVSLVKGLENLELPQIFETFDKLEILRAYKLANEFGLDFIVKGGGDSFERIEAIKAMNAKLIVPVNFPEPFDVTDPYLARFVSLAQLKEWEMKPYNPYILHKNKIPFAFTSYGLKKKEDFLKNIRLSIKKGLSKKAALEALTINPASFLGIQKEVGTLEEGKLANFLIVKGDLFLDGEIYENWSVGKRNQLKDIKNVDIRGTYNLNLNGIVYGWNINGDVDKLTSELSAYVWRNDSISGTRKMDTLELKPMLKLNGLQFSMTFIEEKGNYDGVVQINGSYNPSLGAFHGRAQLPNGDFVDWSAIRSEKYKEIKKKEDFQVDTSSVDRINYPNMAYGFDSLPRSKTYFIKNATLWTNEDLGVIKNANLLIQDGKIKGVHEGIHQIPNNAIVIDGTGKHVTTGIIDEHSHIAVSKGVNESGQSNSAEVSIQDVVRSNDINIYRQLAGGVTTSQLLHGSANPIGGQSALIKLKWGFTPEEMLIENAPKFIKFALGENVKQSNWGDHQTVRFPQTRMGVEQVFYDAFIRAKAYELEWESYLELSDKKKSKTRAPRRDLELEAMVEILNRERFITCHSYIQSEINMLMKVADSMGFVLNTFTHILEGYKLADKMKAHGAGASTFADWWAYKFEVNDAIPYNAAILNEMGIVTAINSDDAEMGRRLNHEAAKIVKYGGVSEEDAWKMITLNPAKLLHLDDRLGSMKEGKDADIVIWSNHPLSIQARVEQTFIDGILFYDINKNVQLHDRDQLERNRIMKLMLEAKSNGVKTVAPFKKINPHYHCDTEGQ